MDQDPQLKAWLRIASFAFPSIVTSLALLLCWRAHFSNNSLRAAAFSLAFGLYCTVYYHRRSLGLSANLGYANPGPDRSWNYNDRNDIGALWAAAIFLGCMAYALFKFW